MLKKLLHNIIVQQGEASLDQCHEVAENLDHKDSYCERVLRHLVEEGKIKKRENNKGHITGYYA